MWNLLKKLITKKNKMDNIEEIDIEHLDKQLSPFVYKWTKGDNDGEICHYQDLYKDPTSGIIWINFKGGTRINYLLLNDFMLQIEPSSIKQGVIEQVANMPIRNVMISENKTQITLPDNPIVSLLHKQKPNWVEVGINLKLNLPTKSLYNVLSSSFDDAEDEIIEFVVKDLDIELIKDSLRINIKDIYNKSNGTSRKIQPENSQKNWESGSC